MVIMEIKRTSVYFWLNVLLFHFSKTELLAVPAGYFQCWNWPKRTGGGSQLPKCL